MGKIIVNKKLDSLYRCIKRIEEKCPADASEPKRNIDLQDVIVLNLSRAVQLCVDIAAHSLTSSSQPVPNAMSEVLQRLAEQHLINNYLTVRSKKALLLSSLTAHNDQDHIWDNVFAVAS